MKVFWVIGLLLLCDGAIASQHGRKILSVNRVTDEELLKEDQDFDDMGAGMFSAPTKEPVPSESDSSDSDTSPAELEFPGEMRFQEKAPTCAYWSKKPASGPAPSGRKGASMVIVGDGARLVLSGGQSGGTGLDDVSVFEIKTSTWTKPLVGGEAAGLARQGQATASLAATDGNGGAELFSFGGMLGSKARNDMMALSVSGTAPPSLSWSKVEVKGEVPAPRQGASLTAMPDRRLIMFGGVSDTAIFKDVWFFRQQASSATVYTWALQAAPAAGPAPKARSGHTASAWSGSNGDRVIVYGGKAQDGSAMAQFAVLNPSTSAGGIAWSLPTLSGGSGAAGPKAAARSGHSALVFKDTLLIFGGCAGSTCFADTLAIDLTAMAWTAVKFGAGGDTATPSARGGAAAALHGSILYLTTGCAAGSGSGGSGKAVCPAGSSVSVLDAATSCDAQCKNGGVMSSGVCVCPTGFTGKFCTVTAPAGNTTATAAAQKGQGCPSDCSGHGSCNSGTCTCKAPYSGADCATKACPADCSGHGTCTDGTCSCTDGYFGLSCAAMSCPGATSCSGKGKCHHDSGLCECWPGFGGDDCSQGGLCPSNCTATTGNGVCTPFREVNGSSATTAYRCVCADHFSGADCSVDTRCPNDLPPATACNGHGKCAGGACACDKGYQGLRCSARTCPGHGSANGTCSGHGSCNNATGVCTCDETHRGDDCADVPLCKTACGEHGSCVRDDEGEAPRGFNGVCKCHESYGGLGCAQRLCPSGVPAPFEKPLPCSGPLRGKCNNDTGICSCRAGYAGGNCSLVCPYGPLVNAAERNGSSSGVGNGSSSSGGDSASVISDAPCSGRGQCVTAADGSAQCFCSPGRSGPACAVSSPCPGATNSSKRGCSGHGVCHSSQCFCDAGWAGEACDTKMQCPTAAAANATTASDNATATTAPAAAAAGAGKPCSGHGVCRRGQCFCAPGFRGDACSTKVPCPSGCSGHGSCAWGECSCAPGWSGEDCGTQLPCPHQCSGHGVCLFSKCVCESGYAGDGCQTFDAQALGLAPPTKAQAKTATTKKAAAGNSSSTGSSSSNSNSTDSSSDSAASGNATTSPRFTQLSVGAALADAVSMAADAGMQLSAGLTVGVADCPGNCGDAQGRGQCILGQCFCSPGFSGSDCATATRGNCPTGCSAHGVCKFNKCFCQPGWQGRNCSVAVECDCSGHGQCKYGRCFCEPGYRGMSCEFQQRCPNSCSDRGICFNGDCMCIPGFGGDDCSQVTQGTAICPKGCAGHGTCQIGQCFCDPGWGGRDCAHPLVAACPNDCFGQGVCSHGRCFCHPGFSGEDCSVPLRCAPGCNRHGVCRYGKCFCQRGYSGRNCSTVVTAEASAAKALSKAKAKGKAPSVPCPNACSLRGFCYDGKCLCESGYDGVACERVVIGTKECPNDCRGPVLTAGLPGTDTGASPQRGMCALGKCFCYPGFAGPACETEVRTPCPADCNNNGLCSYGRCFCHVGFSGSACEKEMKDCPHNCHGNGVCTRGRCMCHSGFNGEFCGKPVASAPCPKKCSGRGVCIMGACVCAAGFSGSGCENSLASQATVRAVVGESDAAHTLRASADPNSVNRKVVKGDDDAAPPHQPAVDARGTAQVNVSLPGGKSGVFRVASPNTQWQQALNTSGKAVAKRARIVAAMPRGAGNATKRALPLPAPTGGATGATGEAGAATAASGATGEAETGGSDGETGGPDAATGSGAESGQGSNSSSSESSGAGGAGGATVFLELSEAPTHAATSAAPASTASGCAPGCAYHGTCHKGRCFCHPGYSGEDCSVAARCPADCGGPSRGVCSRGTCFCAPGFRGDDCSAAVPCAAGCGQHGTCVRGQCLCHPGYGGDDCSVDVDASPANNGCPGSDGSDGGCSGHGLCRAALCFCASGYTGKACEQTAVQAATATTTATAAAATPKSQRHFLAEAAASVLPASLSATAATTAGSSSSGSSNLPPLAVAAIALATFFAGVVLTALVRRSPAAPAAAAAGGGDAASAALLDSGL